MTLIAILLGTVAAGVGSVWLAAALSFAMLARYTQHMLSLAAGALMATAFLHLLPEAFESQAGARDLFLVLLVANSALSPCMVISAKCWPATRRVSCGLPRARSIPSRSKATWKNPWTTYGPVKCWSGQIKIRQPQTLQKPWL